MAGSPEAAPEKDELAGLIREIRERVRARYPNGAKGITLPDLLPVLHARDAARAKVAAIGSVNPRRAGVLNAAIQFVKRAIARALAWHVRDQIEFNRGTIAAIEAILEALNENNRALSDLAQARQAMDDMRLHWSEWRVAWEQRLVSTENELLRTIAELKAAFDFRVSRASDNIQRRLWADLERTRGDYERMIHGELRLIRQRAALPACATSVAPQAAPPGAIPRIDYLRFTDKFRGPEEYVREKQRFYVPHFQNCRDVLDLGCGRGEFLEVMKEAGVAVRGIDLSDELTALCRSKGLDAVTADLLPYLLSLEDESLGGIFCAHVVEHLPTEQLPEVIRAAGAKLRRGGVVAIETPNPECLAIFATHFYLDPTHVRPVPPALLTFYLEEAGFGLIEAHRLSPAIETSSTLEFLPKDFRDAFFGSLDYAVIARKL